jgi:hypothetical protein
MDYDVKIFITKKQLAFLEQLLINNERDDTTGEVVELLDLICEQKNLQGVA